MSVTVRVVGREPRVSRPRSAGAATGDAVALVVSAAGRQAQMQPGHTEQVTVVCLVREVDNPNSTRAAARW